MSYFFGIVKNLFVYKEGTGVKKFELLEDEHEGGDPAKYKPNDRPRRKPESADKAGNTDKSGNADKAAISGTSGTSGTSAEAAQPDTVDPDLAINLEYLKGKFSVQKNRDVITREFNIGQKDKAFILFLSNMADRDLINRSILPNIMNPELFRNVKTDGVIDHITANVLTVDNILKSSDFAKIIDHILNGYTALFVDKCEECILIESRGYEKRAIDTPRVENVVKGSQEAFTEDMKTNVSIIRRIIKNEDLIVEVLTVGKYNSSNCGVLYMDNIVNKDLLKEVKRRLQGIDTDYILGDGLVEQGIEDNPIALFSQELCTERPDRTVHYLINGHVAIIPDGSPFALIVPITFFEMMHASEDLSTRWQFGTFLRLVRYAGLIITLFLSGVYLAVSNFHLEMVPTPLVATIVFTSENVPFPTLIELLLMEFSFELIREGGVRVPGVLGQALGIIGALILGQAAVSAGLVGPILIIVVAISGLGSFTIPNYSLMLGARVLRVVIIFIAAFIGLFGVAIAITVFTTFACSMKSFGVPFFSPVSPKMNNSSGKIMRVPVWLERLRPDYLNVQDRKKIGGKMRGWERRKPYKKD